MAAWVGSRATIFDEAGTARKLAWFEKNDADGNAVFAGADMDFFGGNELRASLECVLEWTSTIPKEIMATNTRTPIIHSKYLLC